MPKVDTKAVLELEDAKAARLVAREIGPLESALYEWMYTNGARASEPGLARLRDVDIRAGRIRLQHLKGGLAPDWTAMATPCIKALTLWLAVRDKYVAQPPQQPFVFPSASPGPCYPCRGKGRITLPKTKRKKPEPGAAAITDKQCHHCDGTGMRWGISRHEVGNIIGVILKKAGVPEGRRHPHVLRHSLVTHLLDAGIPPAAVQERVGHKDVGTTFGYMKATKSARRAIDAALAGDDE